MRSNSRGRRFLEEVEIELLHLGVEVARRVKLVLHVLQRGVEAGRARCAGVTVGIGDRLELLLMRQDSGRGDGGAQLGRVRRSGGGGCGGGYDRAQDGHQDGYYAY